MMMIVQERKFDDILQLDYFTLSEFFTRQELKLLLQLEPLTRDVQSIFYDYMLDFAEVEMYEWAAIFRNELDRREPLTI